MIFFVFQSLFLTPPPQRGLKSPSSRRGSKLNEFIYIYHNFRGVVYIYILRGAEANKKSFSRGLFFHGRFTINIYESIESSS